MSFSKYSFRILTLGLCFGLATSCAKREETDTTVTNDTTVAANGSDTRMTGDSATNNTSGNAMNGGTNNAGGMNMSSMNDGNILAFMGMSDSMEIAMGNMAKSKAKNADVKKFAQMMVTEHTKMKSEGKMVAQKQSITPAMPANWTPNSEMMAQADALKNASGSSFDSLYIANQVAAHQMVLDALNSANPQDTAVRALGEKAKPHVQHHLEEARRIQGSISSSATGR
jgi:putative membrane protein